MPARSRIVEDAPQPPAHHAPVTAPSYGATSSPGELSPAQILALQRTAGNGAVTRLLASRAEPTPALAREAATATPAERVQHMVADADARGIVAVGVDELSVSTPWQRAGMVKVLTDLLWTDDEAEVAIVRIIAHGAEGGRVAGALDAIGYRQKVLDAVDDDARHAELVRLLGPAPAGKDDGAIGKALASGRAADVMAIGDFSAASDAQRIGLLRILLDMLSSNEAEETRMLDILASAGAGLKGLMAELEGAGLKQSLFDHIDAEPNKQRLAALLTPLHDPELDADLVVFKQGFLEGAVSTLVGGAKSAWASFSLGKAISGILRPILHPIDTMADLFDQAEAVLKAPTLDRVVTVLRDIVGTIAFWCGALALIAAGLSALLGATIVLIPGAAPIGVIAASLTADAAALGIFFLVLAGIKLLVDVGHGGAATTARERTREEQEVGGDLTLAVLVALFYGVVEGLKLAIAPFRAAAVDPAAADPAELEKTADRSKEAEQQARQRAEEVRSKAPPPPEGAKPPETGKPAETPKPPEADKPAELGPDGEKVVASEPTADGHEIRITEEGKCLICTTCEEIAEAFKPELDANSALRAELDRMVAELDPAAKAKAIAELEKRLVQERTKAARVAAAGSAAPPAGLEAPSGEAKPPEAARKPPAAETKPGEPEPRTPAESLRRFASANAAARTALERVRAYLKSDGFRKSEALDTGAKRRPFQDELRQLDADMERAEADLKGAETDHELADLAADELDKLRAQAEALEGRARQAAEPQPAGPTVPRPRLPYPKNMLPDGGDVPYRSPGPLEVTPNPKGRGYLDDQERVWQVDPTKARTGRFFEWDVQLPDGSHINVGSDGTITH